MILSGVEAYRAMDPLFECARVVLAQRGEKYSSDYVQGVSGAAFRIAGPCPCAPTCSAAMGTPELVRLLGYEAQELSLRHLPPYGQAADPAAEIRKVVDRVKDEVRAGRAVIVWNAFTMAEWDVVCGFDDATHQFLGRGSYAGPDKYASADEGRLAKGLDICPAAGAILVGRKAGDFDAKAAELAALGEAVRHAHSPADRFLGQPAGKAVPWRFREGLACYDAWIRCFQAEPDHLPGPGDRYPLGVYRSTHRAAAGFCRELAAKHPAAAEQLRKAAEQFAADAEALNQCCELIAPNGQLPKTADPKRSARAAELLTRARAAYAAAIGAVEQALKALAPAVAAGGELRRPARMVRDGQSVRIRNAPDLAWHCGKECTYAGSLEAAMKATEHPYTYADLMGLSALAFRMRWSDEDTKTKWCHSCAVGEMPDEGVALERLTGWKLPGDWIEPKGRDNQALQRKIVAALDAGRCVVTYPQTWDMAVIVGYADGGKTVLVNDYDQKAQPSPLPVEKLNSLQIYLGDYVAPPPMQDCLRDALRMAVTNWRRQRHNGGLEGREYWYGQAAFTAWIKDLRQADKLSAEAGKSLASLHPWVLGTLHDARCAAASFLKDWSTIAAPSAQPPLRAAAALYEKQAMLLAPFVAAYAAQSKSTTTPATQPALAKDADALAEAQKLDEAAIAELDKAMGGMR